MKSRGTRAAAGVAGALAVAAALPGAAGAQERPAETLDTVVVTTKRYPALRVELPQKIEVIGERDLERTPADELADVLKKQAALDVIQYPGLLSGIGIRGFRPEFNGIAKHTLLLIDGRPAGATNLATIDLGSIERIEVLKGPASSLYGSSAMGGAVNLITRRSTGAFGGNASLAYGSWQTLDLSARAGGSLTPRLDADFGLTRFSRGADYRTGEGNLFRGWVGSTEATKLLSPTESEQVAERGDGAVRPNTQYTYGAGNGRLGWRFSDALRVDVRGEAFQADDVETPGDLYVESDPGQRKNLERRSGDVALSGAWGRHTPLLRAYAGHETTDYFNTYAPDPYVSFTGETATRGFQLQDAVRLGAQALTVGVDYNLAGETSQVYSGESTPAAPYSPDATTRSTAAFAEARLALPGGRLSGTLGGRFDRVALEIRETPLRPDWQPDEETFTVFNPSAGLQYAAAPGLRLHGTVGRAFVAPDAFGRAGLSVQRGAAGVATVAVGNPDLDPESSVTWDLGVGVERRALGLDADLTYFDTRVEDRITSVRASFPAGARPVTSAGDPVGSVSTYVNANQARMSGVEWRLGWDLGALAARRYSLRLFANATHFLEREETARSVQVDAGRFAGRTDFRPEEVAGALVFGAETEQQIRNVAGATVNYGVEWDDLRRFSTRLTGRYVGGRTDQDFTDFSRVSDIEYPAFMTLDLVSTLRLADRYAVSLLVDNLTDENYYEKRGFNLPGRALRLRLTADF
jgi:outer membrane receptor protein involved in Fe transport